MPSDYARCRHCGARFSEHRATDAHCPAVPKFPAWPSTIRDEAKAGATYDKRIARHWTMRATAFREAI